MRRILTEAGFEAIDLTEVNEPIPLGADGDDAFGYVATIGMARGMLEGLDEAARTSALERLRATLIGHATSDGVLLPSCSWLITARRPRA